MTGRYLGDAASLLHGDAAEVLRTMPEASIDAVVTDPPYGLSFMGKDWDRGVPGAAYWAEALRVLRPGGHLLAFGGTRTFHRLTVAIEDAGFEIRDCLSWLYGSGFPKSLDVSKAIDKVRDDRAEVLEVTAWVRSQRDAVGITNRNIDAAFGTNGMAGHWTSAASQPAVPTLEQVPTLLAVLQVDLDDLPERIRYLLWHLNGRKGQPGDAWLTAEVLHVDRRMNEPSGIVGLGRERTAVERQIKAPATPAAERWQGWGTALKPAWEPIVLARKPLVGTVAANVLEHGTGALNIDGCRIEAEAGGRRKIVGDYKDTDNNAYAGRMNGSLAGGSKADGSTSEGRWPANVALDEIAAAMLDEQSGKLTSGKVKPEGFKGPHKAEVYGKCANNIINPENVYGDTGGASRFFYCAKASKKERNAGLPQGMKNDHPTVKPVDLMRWLTRLITPPGGTVLDPFMGSGSTGVAALSERFCFVGIDNDEHSLEIASYRIVMAGLAAGFRFPQSDDAA